MKRALWLLPALGLAALLLGSCGQLMPSKQQIGMDARGVGPQPKATGGVDIAWMGGNGKELPPDQQKTARADFAWFAPQAKKKAATGELHYVVYNADGTLHREIIAEVPRDPEVAAALDPDGKSGVVVDSASGKAYFVGLVAYDSRDGSIGDGSKDSGGCSDGTDSCGEGGTEGEGCSGEDSNGSIGPEHPSGNGTRVDEFVAAVVADNGTPGVGHDTIAWSWFYNPNSPSSGSSGGIPDNAAAVPDLKNTTPTEDGRSGPWEALCDKPVLGGNIVVHE